MKDKTLLAERTLFAIDKDLNEFEIHIAIGKPYIPAESDFWACPVSVDGLHNNLHDIYGVDSWQSLQLALKLVRVLLEDFVEKGGKMFFEKGFQNKTTKKMILPLCCSSFYIPQ